MIFPFHNYLGPGNHIENGPPVDPDDEIAFLHDIAYEIATSPDDVRKADLEAIRAFDEDFIKTRNWHSTIGSLGLSIKYNIEKITDVIYYPNLPNEYYQNMEHSQQALFIMSRTYPAGVMGLLVGHPMDTMKIRSQTMPNKGLFQIIKNTFQLEGFRGFYKGFLAPMLTTGVTNAVFFGVYGNTIRLIENKYDVQTEYYKCGNYRIAQPVWRWDVFLSGAFAGLFNAIISAPVEAIKTRMQAEVPMASQKLRIENDCSSTWKTIKYIKKHEGIPGYFRGQGALMLRDIPSYGVYMVIYKFLSHTLQCMDYSPTFAYGVAGGFAGIISWAVVMPFDVIKSSIQADDLIKPKYNGIIDCFQKSYRQYGLPIFMKGFCITTIRAFPVNLVMFIAYENFQNQCLKL